MCGEQHELTPTAVPTPAPTHKNESLNVGARDICVGNDASSTLLDFDATMSNWVEIDDVPLSSACTWVVMDADAVQSSYALDIDGADGSSTHAIRQTSNAWGNYPGDNTLTGCNLLYNTSSYTNFILEAKMYHSDNDGVGLVFGWKGLLDHYQAAMINDIWPSPPADGISGPHMKLKRRRKACSASMSGPYVDGSTTGEDCYETLSYLNNAGASSSMAEDLERVDVNAYYHDSYADYPNYGTATETSHSIYLIVKDNTVRFGRWDSDLSKWVMVWADVPDYAGGKVGIFTYAHQPTVWDVKITDLDATPNPTMCNGGGDCELGVCTCYDGFDYDNELTGTCASQHLLTPTSVPTPVPTPLTWSPTLTRNVGAADVCLGNDGTSTLLDFDSAITGWTEVDDTPLSGTCSWTAYDSDTVLGWRGIDIDGADGISTYAVYQSSNSWGNHPGDNTLTGCNLLYDGATYTNFILEAKMYHSDNDGVGFVFGWNDLLDHYQAAMINDQWPSPPADGISGPHMKLKRRRKACSASCSVAYVDGNTADEDCYETLAYLNNGGASSTLSAAAGDLAGDLESPINQHYNDAYFAYPNYGTPSETAAPLYLIVNNSEVRFGRWDTTLSKWVMTWAELPSAYAGGKIGLFTYAHQPLIWDVKITDLDATSPMMCGGAGTCDMGVCDCDVTNDAYYAATGLCEYTTPSVGAGDICVGNGASRTAIDIDSTLASLSGDGTSGSWTSSQDASLTSSTCAWSFMSPSDIASWGYNSGGPGIYQSSNSWGNYPGDNTIMGCNLYYNEQTYTNFIMEATLANGDNDGVGFVFGWTSIDDHYQAIAINDQWPNPPADGVGGPHIKLKYRNPAYTCSGSMDSTNNCYETLSYIDSTSTSMDSLGNLLPHFLGTYTDFSEDFSVGTKIYLIVNGTEARWGWWDTTYKKWMMTWATLPDSYAGGYVGFTTYAHQPLFESVYITDLDALTDDLVMCNGQGSCVAGACVCDNSNDMMADIDGTCEPVSNVGAGNMCPLGPWYLYTCFDQDNDGEYADPGGYTCASYNANTGWCGDGTYDDSDFSHDLMCCGCGGGATYEGAVEIRTPVEIDGSLGDLYGDGSESVWDAIADDPISGTCNWQFFTMEEMTLAGVPAITDSIYQSSNSWGNAPGDNTLTGCNLLYNAETYTNFVLEATVSHNDNDGVGFVFGWQNSNDYYQAVMINDQWPNPPADGVGGPVMKIKYRNPSLPECTGSMDSSTTCFDTLAYIDANGVTNDMDMTGLSGDYHTTYADYSESPATATRIHLVVNDGEARWGWWDSDEQKWMMTWASLDSSYAGGMLGFMTYAHQPLIQDIHITDLDAVDLTANPCGGHGTCA